MRLIPIILLLTLLVPTNASAWGFEIHRFITTRAIDHLPPEIRPYFEKFRAEIVEHSIDPDLWRNAGFEEEPPRHFVDMDAYGPYPFKDMPAGYDEAVKKHGLDFVKKNGLLPWRTEEMFDKLVEAFTQKGPYSRENIKFFASVVAHYVADGHVPFHAALNYDGQLTGQWGIHSRFETELFLRNRDTLAVTPRPLVPVASARDFMFETLRASFPYVQPILDADKAAVEGREIYDDGYFTLFFSRTRPILEQRLSDSVTHVASMITGAWIAAGKPALPLDVVPAPRRVRRQ